jgi:hypothetical protein
MTAFEYVIVLISIILGLGITQIMTGLADLVHQWNNVKLYWPHLIWIVLVFVLHIQDWWDTYHLQTFQPWRLPTFLFFSLYPVNLFILARILFPFNSADGIIDLKKFYYGNFRKFFLCTMVLNVLSIVSNYIVRGLEISLLIPLAIFFLLGWVAWKNIQTESTHKVIAGILLVVLTIGIIVNWNTWLIG